MSLTEELPIYRATYRLLNLLIRATQDFPRFYKYSLGTRMVDICLDMSMLLYKANSSYEKTEPLREFLGKFGMLQLLLVCAEQKVIDTKKVTQIIAKYRKTIDLLESVSGVEDLFRYHSLHYEALVGDKIGLESVRVNDQYRIEFRTTKVVSEIVVTVCNIIELSNHYK